MKKLLTGIMVLAMVGIATADISIAWKQTSAFVMNQGNTSVLSDGYAQLIWSLTCPTAPATDADPDLLAAGEYLLDEITISGSTGLQFNIGSAQQFADLDVDGNTVTDGAFYTRIFDAPDKASVAAGTLYVQNATTGPGLTTYNYQDTATVYADNVFPSAATYPVDTAVVPEPNSILLLGLLGVSVYRYRKSQQKI